MNYISSTVILTIQNSTCKTKGRRAYWYPHHSILYWLYIDSISSCENSHNDSQGLDRSQYPQHHTVGETVTCKSTSQKPLNSCSSLWEVKVRWNWCLNWCHLGGELKSKGQAEEESRASPSKVPSERFIQHKCAEQGHTVCRSSESVTDLISPPPMSYWSKATNVCEKSHRLELFLVGWQYSLMWGRSSSLWKAQASHMSQGPWPLQSYVQTKRKALAFTRAQWAIAWLPDCFTFTLITSPRR